MANNHVKCFLLFAKVEPDNKPKVVADNGKKHIENRRVSETDVTRDIIEKIDDESVDAKNYGPRHDKRKEIRAVFRNGVVHPLSL